MERREFFRHGMRKVSEAVVKQADARVSQRAAHWIRPPYALNELEFLLACNRCGDCIEACPHQVIFPLAARLGPEVAATPALDLLHKGCHLCADWPCVTVCEPGALQIPAESDTEASLPRLAVARIDTATCLPYNGPECGACASSCPVTGALLWEGEKPRIDMAVCSGCGLCREACILEPKAITIQSLYRQP